MNAPAWGVRTRGGQYVLEDFRVVLCPVCHRLEVYTWERGKVTRVTYSNDTPVLHRR